MKQKVSGAVEAQRSPALQKIVNFHWSLSEVKIQFSRQDYSVLVDLSAVLVFSVDSLVSLY